MPDWTALTAEINRLTGDVVSPAALGTASGGCINRTAVLDGRTSRYFLKYNEPARLDMFAAEAEGLEALGAARAVRVPKPICWGTAGGVAFLVLEHLDLAPADARTQALLGERLAALHGVTRPQHGWHRDNTIGTTPQHNAQTPNWAEFFREQRLRPQLQLASEHGYWELTRAGEKLLVHVDALLAGHAPAASLLHGDLWGGNAAATAAGEPVIFDPAVYFGDREADIAMTELFGGFANTFYEAYRAAWPLPPGYRTRRTLYNLYHVLNHANLFGGGYADQARRMIDALLAEVR